MSAPFNSSLKVRLHPDVLVSLYRAFYRAGENQALPSYRAIYPVWEGCEAICNIDPALCTPSILTDLICDRLTKLMEECRGNGASACCVATSPVEESQAILRFSQYLVESVFFTTFNGDVALFRGKQRKFLEDTCEFFYKRAEELKSADKPVPTP